MNASPAHRVVRPVACLIALSLLLWSAAVPEVEQDGAIVSKTKKSTSPSPAPSSCGTAQGRFYDISGRPSRPPTGARGPICQDTSGGHPHQLLRAVKSRRGRIKGRAAIGTRPRANRWRSHDFFAAKFSEALKTVASSWTSSISHQARGFRDRSSRSSHRLNVATTSTDSGHRLPRTDADDPARQPVTSSTRGHPAKITELTTIRARPHQRVPAHRAEGDHRQNVDAREPPGAERQGAQGPGSPREEFFYFFKGAKRRP